LDIPSHGFDLLIPSNYVGYPEVKYDAAQLDVFRDQDNLWAWWVHQVEARDSEVCFFVVVFCACKDTV
jgi:hypothetical protein